MNFHTLIAKNGGRTTENEAGEVSGETELFSSIFPAKSRRLTARPGWGRKRTAARSFWYRPRRLWWPDERTAGQNVASCGGGREPEERERGTRARERV
ncbi:unnamed protein product [Prunus armeniaca]